MSTKTGNLFGSKLKLTLHFLGKSVSQVFSELRGIVKPFHLKRFITLFVYFGGMNLVLLFSLSAIFWYAEVLCVSCGTPPSISRVTFSLPISNNHDIFLRSLDPYRSILSQDGKYLYVAQYSSCTR
jgi:hypothetical protein